MIALLIWLIAMPPVPASSEPHPPGLPRYTHPRSASARTQARARVWAVYRAIDAATTDPAIRMELRRVCRRESACNWHKPITIHPGDARGGKHRWRKAVARGLLNPTECAEHDLGNGAKWSTYGPFGIAAAWVVDDLGECVGPEALDDEHVSARAAVRWIETLCRRHGACTCEEHVPWWVGPGVWAERSELAKVRSITGQCGVLPWWRWAWAGLLDAVAMAGCLQTRS